MFKMIAGRKFEIFLSEFSLSSGTTRAVLANSEKMLCSILELIDLVKSGVKKIFGYFYQFWGNGVYSSSFFRI